MAEQGQEIATTAEASGMATIEPTPELVGAYYAAVMEGQLPPEVGDPKIMQQVILQRIKEGTFEETLDPAAKLPSLQAYVGVPLVFHGFHVNPSAFRDNKDNASPSSVYAVISISDAKTGEADVVQFGGLNVLMQLGKAWEERKFPFQAKLEASTTGQGYTTYWLRWPDEAEAEG